MSFKSIINYIITFQLYDETEKNILYKVRMYLCIFVLPIFLHSFIFFVDEYIFNNIYGNFLDALKDEFGVMIGFGLTFLCIYFSSYLPSLMILWDLKIPLLKKIFVSFLLLLSIPIYGYLLILSSCIFFSSCL